MSVVCGSTEQILHNSFIWNSLCDASTGGLWSLAILCVLCI